MPRREYLWCLHDRYLDEARKYRMKLSQVPSHWEPRRQLAKVELLLVMQVHYTRKASRCLGLLTGLTRREKDRHPWPGFRHPNG